VRKPLEHNEYVTQQPLDQPKTCGSQDFFFFFFSNIGIENANAGAILRKKKRKESIIRQNILREVLVREATLKRY
jgi:hypothetical protein